MATTTSWKGGNGNWQTAAKWTAGAPTANSFAVINAPGTYTINIGTGQEYHVSAVALNDAGATLAIAGILTIKNRLTVFKGALDLSGTIEGGSIAAQGGSIAFLGGTLNNVDFRGALNLETSGTLTIANGMTLHDANGSGNCHGQNHQEEGDYQGGKNEDIHAVALIPECGSWVSEWPLVPRSENSCRKFRWRKEMAP